MKPLWWFALGALAGYIARGLLNSPALAAQGFHEGVWYDDLAAKPIEHTIFGPFQNEYEDPLAGETPAGLTPPPQDIRLAIA